jgi:murein DD-endopeptidase MepM/ murein hydrolase activator NlpD
MITKNTYNLPFYKKDLIDIISDSKVHFAHFKHAIDFILPKGSKILAAKSGKVVDLKVNSNKGGSSLRYNNIKYTNYITLKHSNEEYSQYIHLKHLGNLVKVGDKVRTQQPIAISGNTGFLTREHLHFQVFRLNKTDIGWETLKIKFKDRIRVNRI